jgi:hypothetical protein
MILPSTIEGHVFEEARMATLAATAKGADQRYAVTLSPRDLHRSSLLGRYTSATITYTDHSPDHNGSEREIVTVNLTGQVDHGEEPPLVTSYSLTRDPTNNTTVYERSVAPEYDTDIQQLPLTTNVHPGAVHASFNPDRESLLPAPGDVELLAAAIRLVQNRNRQ